MENKLFSKAVFVKVFKQDIKIHEGCCQSDLCIEFEFKAADPDSVIKEACLNKYKRISISSPSKIPRLALIPVQFFSWMTWLRWVGGRRNAIEGHHRMSSSY